MAGMAGMAEMTGIDLTSAWPGLLMLLLVVGVWVAVQSAWRRSFPDPSGELDALAGRGGCHGCRGGECRKECDAEGAKRPDVAGRSQR